MAGLRESPRLRAALVLCASVLLSGVLLSPGSLVLAGGGTSAPGADGTGLATPGALPKSTEAQDPTFLALKDEYRIGRDSQGTPVVLSQPALLPLTGSGSGILSASLTQYLEEPLGSGYDDQSKYYSDKNYWNFCGAGAAEAALSYWPNSVSKVTSAHGTYEEPYLPPDGVQVKTYWNASDSGKPVTTKGRGYLMYLAESVKVYGWTYGGVVSFNINPVGSWNPDIRDGINWEASDENQNSWLNYFYVWNQWSSSATAGILHSDIVIDIVNFGAPVIVSALTGKLPGWNPNSTADHEITIIGYDDFTGTYQYIDTCGKQCGSGQDGGLHTISQTQLWNAVYAIGVSNYGANAKGWIW